MGHVFFSAQNYLLLFFCHSNNQIFYLSLFLSELFYFSPRFLPLTTLLFFKEQTHLLFLLYKLSKKKIIVRFRFFYASFVACLAHTKILYSFQKKNSFLTLEGSCLDSLVVN